MIKIVNFHHDRENHGQLSDKTFFIYFGVCHHQVICRTFDNADYCYVENHLGFVRYNR